MHKHPQAVFTIHHGIALLGISYFSNFCEQSYIARSLSMVYCVAYKHNDAKAHCVQILREEPTRFV